MEELAGLDLLKCPLCYEQLDVTAKVLPCQHTFCQPCLRRLASARPELRCPECRALVLEGVEELPANVLLLRLLEDFPHSLGRTSRGGTIRYRPHQDLSLRTKEARYTPRQIQVHKNLDGVAWARAVYNYQANLPGELNIKPGDVIILRRRVDENWYHGEANGNSGLVPASMVQVINQLPQPLPLCRAVHDFELKEKELEDSRDFLTFLKGDIITLLRRVDESWAEGKLGEKVGIFPVQFTEPNPAAIKLLEKSKASSCLDARLWVAGGNCDVAVDSGGRRLSSGSAPGPAVLAPIVSTLNSLNRPAQGPSGERQAPSVSPPTYLGSSNTGVVAQLQERRPDALSNTPFQGPSLAPCERKVTHERPPTITMALVSPQTSGSSESKQSSTQQLSISVCAVLYSYTPHRPEELELHKGEMVGVYGRFKEGWLRGLSLRTGRVGILPGNYVTPVLRTSAKFVDARVPPPPSSTTVGKRSMVSKAQVGGATLDKFPANGTIRSAGHIPPGTVMSSTSAISKATHPGTVRRVFHPPHRRTSQGTLSSRIPSAAVRPQQAGLSRGSVQNQGLASPSISSKIRNAHLTRFSGWAHETAAPSAGDSLTLTSRDVTVKEAPERQTSAGPQSILVKPDSYKNNAEKPMKSVRFLTEETPSAGGYTDTSSELGVPALEVRGNIPGPLGSESSGLDSKAAVQRKGMALNPSTSDSQPAGLKTSVLSAAPSCVSRHRATSTYVTQGDGEEQLKEVNPGVAQRLRQDGRTLVTQERSGRTSLSQGSTRS